MWLFGFYIHSITHCVKCAQRTKKYKNTFKMHNVKKTIIVLLLLHP